MAKKTSTKKGIHELPQPFIDTIVTLIVEEYLPRGIKSIVDKKELETQIRYKLSEPYALEIEKIADRTKSDYAHELHKQKEKHKKELSRLNAKIKHLQSDKTGKKEKPVKKLKMELPRLPKKSCAQLFMEEDMDGNWLRYTRLEKEKEPELTKAQKKSYEQELQDAEKAEQEREALLAIPHKSQMSLF